MQSLSNWVEIQGLDNLYQLKRRVGVTRSVMLLSMCQKQDMGILALMDPSLQGEINKMHKDYEKVTEQYLRISTETRNKLTALSITVIGAIYFFSSGEKNIIFNSSVNIFSLKVSLVLYILTIVGEVVAGFLKSQHYSLWYDGKIDTIDLSESVYGKTAEVFFWLPPIFFVLGTICFLFALFNSGI